MGITKISFADVGMKSVPIGQTARKKPMTQLLPLLSDDERSGSEDEAASDSSTLDSVLTNSEHAVPAITSMLGATFDNDYTPQVGAGSTEEESGKITTDSQYPLLLSSLKKLSQSVISNVRNSDGSVSEDAMHTYLQMLAQAHRESTQANTVAVQHPSFWVVSEVLSEGSKRFWRRLTDSHMIDTAVLHKVLIPRLHQDHWKLFVIDRDLRMIKVYCPAGRTIRIDDRDVSSTIDIKNLPLTNQVLCRSS
jgi:hypothetical protein